MLQRFTNAFGKVFLTISVNREEGWIYTKWEGYLSEANTKAGSFALTDVIRETGLQCVLSDMLSVVGPIGGAEWAAREWTLQAAKAGLKYMALVNPPVAIANLSVSNFHSTQVHFQSKVFHHLEEAKDWLRQFC